MAVPFASLILLALLPAIDATPAPAGPSTALEEPLAVVILPAGAPAQVRIVQRTQGYRLCLESGGRVWEAPRLQVWRIGGTCIEAEVDGRGRVHMATRNGP